MIIAFCFVSKSLKVKNIDNIIDISLNGLSNVFENKICQLKSFCMSLLRLRLA